MKWRAPAWDASHAILMCESGGVAITTPSAPSSASSSVPQVTPGTDAAGEMSHARTSQPSVRKLPTCRLPMPPSPITATFIGLVESFDETAHLVRLLQLARHEHHYPDHHARVVRRLWMFLEVAPHRVERLRDVSLVHISQRSLFAPCQMFRSRVHALPPR